MEVSLEPGLQREIWVQKWRFSLVKTWKHHGQIMEHYGKTHDYSMIIQWWERWTSHHFPIINGGFVRCFQTSKDSMGRFRVAMMDDRVDGRRERSGWARGRYSSRWKMRSRLLQIEFPNHIDKIHGDNDISKILPWDFGVLFFLESKKYGLRGKLTCGYGSKWLTSSPIFDQGFLWASWLTILLEIDTHTKSYKTKVSKVLQTSIVTLHFHLVIKLRFLVL